MQISFEFKHFKYYAKISDFQDHLPISQLRHVVVIIRSHPVFVAGSCEIWGCISFVSARVALWYT